LIERLDVLEFRSSNTSHRPMLDALDLVAPHKDGRVTFYPAGEQVPVQKGVWWVIGPMWCMAKMGPAAGGAVHVRDAFQALRERPRC
jgi:hypothetical protein